MASDRPHSLTFTANYSKTFGKGCFVGSLERAVDVFGGDMVQE